MMCVWGGENELKCNDIQNQLQTGSQDMNIKVIPLRIAPGSYFYSPYWWFYINIMKAKHIPPDLIPESLWNVVRQLQLLSVDSMLH